MVRLIRADIRHSLRYHVRFDEYYKNRRKKEVKVAIVAYLQKKPVSAKTNTGRSNLRMWLFARRYNPDRALYGIKSEMVILQ